MHNPTLFDGHRLSLADALQQTADSLTEYGRQHKHWVLAFSGGKDSSATVTATDYLIASGRVPAPETKTALYADTRLELPNLQAAAVGMLAALRDRGWDTRTVLPKLDKRFMVMMLGRGVPPSHSGFRWCTGAIKIDPMDDAMREIRARTGEKLLLIVGLRVGESAARDKRIAISCGKNGGECGQGWYQETTDAEVAHVLAPLLHWRTCHVWDWLSQGLRAEENPHPERTAEWKAWYKARREPCHGFDCRAVCEVYDHDVDGSLNEVLSRTGCLVCPVASKDHALERTLAKPEWAYLAPLRRLRLVYDELTHPRSRIRKVGEKKKDGSLSSRPMRMGPLTMAARQWGQDQVERVQADVNAEARRQGRPEISLINEEEVLRIVELRDANTWPDGWTGEEEAGDALVPEVRKDGVIQPILFEEGGGDQATATLTCSPSHSSRFLTVSRTGTRPTR